MDLQIEGTKVLQKNLYSDKRIIINRGGTRSSKSYSLAQAAVLFLFTGYVSKEVTLGKGVWSIVRKTLPALKASVLRDFEEILHHHDLHQYTDINKTELTFRYKDRMVEFFSVDDQQKVRSRKRDVLNICEANEVEYNDFRQLILRTQYRVYLDFNPDDINTWIKTELEDKRQHEVKDVEVIVSSYKDNGFLSYQQIKEIELLNSTDPEYWKIFGLGEYGTITGLIFPDVRIVDRVPNDARLVAIGLDFGFTNDPTACYEVYLNGGELYLNQLIYETGLTNNDIATRLNLLGFSIRVPFPKTQGMLGPYQIPPTNHAAEIIADSAEPKSIEELYRMGFNVKPAHKGPDSVKNGIDILKRYRLNVTAASTGLIKESKAYKWDTDKNGNTLNKPIDKFNHAWDAVRYVALNKLAVKPTSNWVL